MIHARNRPFFNCRTDCFKYSFFPNSLSEWSQLVPEIQNSEFIVVFKSKLLSFIRPSNRSIFSVNDPEGVKYLTRLRLRFSHLIEHKFRHGFLDTLNPLCNCRLDVEDNEHFQYHCFDIVSFFRFKYIFIFFPSRVHPLPTLFSLFYLREQCACAVFSCLFFGCLFVIYFSFIFCLVQL